MVSFQPEMLDAVFHALAHPARREILRRLTERERNLSDLASPLEMSFPAASKHVRVLERAGLVERRVEGRSHVCRINAEPLRQVAEWTEAYRAFWEANFVRLDAVLEEMKAEAKRKPGGSAGEAAGGNER
ncbi:MAG: winged helix-turn-helix transcriptional regulator [Phycisphaerales bacterium]|nr:winged helix-turn-helix transcriptional regulator [Phycisphaerales bacterium]